MCTETEFCEQTVCLKDFCGTTMPGSFPVQYWADWCPVNGEVYFGGDWCEVPPMPAKTMPTDEQWSQWVEANGG